ncbi:UPF0538 protein C2orf76 homolog [Xenia sp. Carnegie-2017]|uniref:UPF0538 protein C2orf76 homolog n=1 Tax=Xenia sp. Carnegie-2017 TaxID=2897299 RepID=UPI001F03F4A0|nr:UPF0538 protein C2orf76 homolog [Xenia sp. Carnegie-2017]
MVTVTVRLIRSFEYRNMKNIVLQNVDLDISVDDFKALISQEIKKSTFLPPPFKNFPFDTLKIECKAHRFKKLNFFLAINWSIYDFQDHETEISYFKNDDYLDHKKNKKLKW